MTGAARLSVDVVGVPGGATGWATHSVEFARALRAHAAVNFRTSRRNALRALPGRDAWMLVRGQLCPPGDFCVVVTGTAPRREAAARWIVWETTELPAAQRVLCDSVDVLWTPSRWGRENLLANGVDPSRIDVVPEGVDTAFYSPGPARPAGRPFRFLSVGKWEARKFCEGLIAAFCAEFAPGEPVELYMQAHNAYVPGFSLPQAIAAASPRADARIVPGAPLDRDGLRALYRSADCFVLPTRAEGWGLPILEAMACGVPPIVTRYSAPLDFVDDDCGFLVDVEALVPARDPVFGIDTGRWAQPSVAHLRRLMRQAYEGRDAALPARGRRARARAECFSWDHAAQVACAAMKRRLAARR